MSEYDNIMSSMTKLYDAAQRELAELETKRQSVLRTIANLERIIGTDAVTSVAPAPMVSAPAATTRGKELFVPATTNARISAPVHKVEEVKRRGRPLKKIVTKSSTRAPRIREEELRLDVLNFFGSRQGSLSAAEVIEHLLASGYPNTTSFKTRVYSKLVDWSKEHVLERVDRGVYKLGPGGRNV